MWKAIRFADFMSQRAQADWKKDRMARQRGYVIKRNRHMAKGRRTCEMDEAIGA